MSSGFMSRRRFASTVVASSSLLLAGCSSDDDGGDSDDSDAENQMNDSGSQPAETEVVGSYSVDVVDGKSFAVDPISVGITSDFEEGALTVQLVTVQFADYVWCVAETEEADSSDLLVDGAAASVDGLSGYDAVDGSVLLNKEGDDEGGIGETVTFSFDGYEKGYVYVFGAMSGSDGVEDIGQLRSYVITQE